MASAADTAANFGYSMAFFQSDPELKKLLNSGVTGNWTPQQFVAKLQNTKWFKAHGEAARQVWALKTSDPATYNQRLATATQQVKSLAYQFGAGLTPAALNSLAAHALAFGWSDDQIKNGLVMYVKADSSGAYKGNAATAQRQITEMAAQYGVTPTANQVGGWVRNMMIGASTPDQVKQSFIAQAASRYPGLKDRLMAGETLDQIASPYKDSYSKVLETPGDQIKLDDPLIKQALGAKDKDGKPTTKSLWQFESDLKSDPRWLKTDNARQDLVGTTHKLLTDFGLVS